VPRRTAPADPSLALPGAARLAVPVFGAAGGVGASTATALLAGRLHAMLPAPRAVAVIDTARAQRSPWPGAMTLRPVYGISELTYRPSVDLVGQASGRVDLPGGFITVLADTNRAPAGGYSPVVLEPDLFHPFFSAPMQAVLLDADAEEGGYLADHAAGGPPSRAHRWHTFGLVCLAVLWVTTATPTNLARTIAAVTAAERSGADPSCWVVVVNLSAPASVPKRVRADLELITDRVAAIQPLEHRPALAASTTALSDALCEPPRPDTLALAAAVAAAARVPLARPAADDRRPVHRKVPA
jgi:hypothetical protein